MRSIGGSIGPLILCLSLLLHGVAARNFKRNAIPKYQFDDNTAPCAWWLDNDKEGSWTCQGIQDAFAVSMVDFLRWVCPISRTSSDTRLRLAEPLCPLTLWHPQDRVVVLSRNV